MLQNMSIRFGRRGKDISRDFMLEHNKSKTLLHSLFVYFRKSETEKKHAI